MEDLIELTKKFCSAAIEPHVMEWEERKWFPNSVFDKLSKAGFLGLIIPEKYGGLGLEKEQVLRWLETFGEIPCMGFTVGVAMSSIVCAKAIMEHGTDEQRALYLPKIASGEIICAYAFTEPQSGTDLRAIRTSGQKTDNGFILNGQKTFITNGARANLILVFGKCEGTYNIFLTKGDTVFVESKLDKLGWHSSDTCILTFRDTPAELLGQNLGQGLQYVQESLSFERLVLSAIGIGLTRRALKDLQPFASTRIIKGRPLSSYPLFKKFIKKAVSQLWLFSYFLHHAASKDNFEFSTVLKSYVSDKLCEIADQVLQFYGGYGYTKDYLIERIDRDLRLLPIGGGAREALYESVFRRLKKRISENRPKHDDQF
ncbi:MAG: acyl-CoA/acyl-ACP dehydrogenase [Deltaproteobacteria bacterium]|nr:acyl-CoA/acyl-ACP dehydrogenase [Deltaproteobacteria bacterium]